MFGALNRFISRLDSEPQDQPSSATRDAAGFHVLKNTNQELAIEPWFDFVIGINGRTIVCNGVHIPKLIPADTSGLRTIRIQTCLRLKFEIALDRLLA